MTTAWTSPTIITQYAEAGAESVHVPWTGTIMPLSTDGSLEHIARSPKHDIRTKTYYLKFTGFNFENLPATISGIELKLDVQRRGRVTDETVDLYVADQAVGNNQATLELVPTKIYGGETDLWAMENLLLADVEDNNFGVVIRFQAHPHWPHKDHAFVNAVELRIH
jgi:hypothetical protein